MSGTVCGSLCFQLLQIFPTNDTLRGKGNGTMEAQRLWFVVVIAAAYIGMASAQTDKCGSDIDWILSQISGGCGGRIVVTANSPGWFRPPPATSPYGGGDNYESNLVCVWYLIAPEGTQLKLTQDQAFAFEIAESCQNDKLVISNTEYCRDNPFTSITLSSNKAVATFLSDRSIGGRGFNIKVEYIGTPTSHGNKRASAGYVLMSAICALMFYMM